jgi:CBS domain-containing protein
MGVSAVVSGSYLLNGTSIPAALLRLKTEATTSAYRVEDFMLDLTQTPLLLEKEANLPRALAVVENFRHGLAIVVDEKRVLQGIITNADIRRGLLRNLTDFNQVGLPDMLNPNPAFAYADMTVTELLKMIRQTPFPVNYLPVLNQEKQVAGLLTFNDLIKGE